MCSFFGQIAYGALMILCLGLTSASLFSDNWYSDGNDKHSGILTCYDKNLSEEINKEICKNWWKLQSDSTKAVIILMGIAIAVEIFAIIWTLASFCACCCRAYFLHVLPTLAVITTVLLAAAMILFATNHKLEKLNDDGQSLNGSLDNLDNLDSVSYSFWIGIGATLIALAAAIIGSITAFLGDHCC